MKRTWVVSIVGVTLVLAVAAAVALECPVKVLFQKFYRLVDDEGEDVGSYAIDFDGYEDDVIMADELEVTVRERSIGYRSSGTFSPDADGVMRPTVMSASTFIDGNQCMRGTVTFEETTYRYFGEGVLDKRSGEAIDPPATFEQEDISKPGPLIVFPQALIFLGPVWQGEDGEQPVAVAEFPDDIGAPELITIKEDYRLVRQSLGDEGGFAIELLGPEDETPMCRAEYDSDGECVSLKLFPKWDMAECDEDGEIIEADEVEDADEAEETPEKTDE